MSAKIDITGKIFNDILVLEFLYTKNTHATYKCLCMRCNNTFVSTYTNLNSGNTKSCQRCGQKRISNGKEQDIFWELQKGGKISHIAEKFDVSRGVVYRIKKEFLEAK